MDHAAHAIGTGPNGGVNGGLNRRFIQRIPLDQPGTSADRLGDAISVTGKEGHGMAFIQQPLGEVEPHVAASADEKERFDHAL